MPAPARFKPEIPYIDPETGFTLDLSGLDLQPAEIAALVSRPKSAARSPMEMVHAEMQNIERGEIKNPDEGRRVTHFTDRSDYPKSALFEEVQRFAAAVRAGDFHQGSAGVQAPIEAVIMNGIGGSALGPQLVQFALNGPYWNELSRERRRGYPKIYFLDNTDPAGVRDVLEVVDLARALVVTVSKSGRTRETVNNRVALERAYAALGDDLARHAVAVTMPDSDLAKYAKAQGWLKVFPLAESIGGRTSETNIVGHVPAALTGIDFAAMLRGACYMDGLTRLPAIQHNPAYQLAAAWYLVGGGRGDRNMVVIPYSDRLLLLARYLQQLVMESLGKALDLDGRPVHQGLTVYGNKGGTDAHAYVQQLNDGRDDFFVTFIEILRDAAEYPASGAMTMGDYLHAFKRGLTRALRAKGRKVIDIRIPELSPFTLGMLIALYERTVAAYAELIHINAFHQPGVEAYKKTSGRVAEIHENLVGWVGALDADWSGDAAQAAAAAGLPPEDAPEVERLLERYGANRRRFGERVITREFSEGGWRYRAAPPQSESGEEEPGGPVPIQ